MRDDIDQARKAGYSDEQILSVMGESAPDMKGQITSAIRSGYTPAQVLTVMQEGAGEHKRAAMQNQSWGDYATDLAKGLVYGAGQEARSVGTALSQPSDANPANAGVVNAAGAALRTTGQDVAGSVGPYTPSQFDIGHPLATAGQIPKAVAESGAGLAATLGSAALGGASAGAIGGAIAGPVGAAVGGAVGGLGGAGAYAFTKYWGSNAQAHAEEQGRAAPAQKDFDATVKESATMAGVDVASLKAGGLLSKAAKGGLATKALDAAKASAAMGAQGAVNSAIGQTAAMDETKAGQDSIGGRLANVDLNEAASAGAVGAATGLAARGAEPVGRGVQRTVGLPGEVLASRMYGVKGELSNEALTRVSDHMTSDAFPGDPSKASQTRANLKGIKSFTGDRIDQMVANPEAFSLDGKAKSTVAEARSYLNAGAVYSEAQLAKLRTALGDTNGEVFNALADRNAVNTMQNKAGQGESQSALGKLAGTILRNPGKSGLAGGAAVELLPAALHVVSGGHLAGGALALKALTKATGVGDALNNPLNAMTRRYASPDAETNPLRQTQSGAAQAADFAALQQAARGVDPSQSPAQAHAPGPATVDAPVSAGPAHAPLDAILGAQAPARFAPQAERPQGATPMAANDTGAAPAGPRPVMSMPDILSEMKIQAAAESQPLLDVAQLHHRSARSIETNKSYSDAERLAAKRHAHEIHETIIKPLEAEATPEEITRARSARQVDAAPAPAPVISPEGATMFEAQAPALAGAIDKAVTPGAARRSVEAFIGQFKARDRGFVRKAVESHPEVKKALATQTIKHSAKGSKAIKAAKVSKPTKATKSKT